MKLLKSICIAFSIYSKIPVPQFPWKQEDMKYHLCFFPWIGAVIGILLLGWNWICQSFMVGRIAYSLIGTAIPLIITGGFHLDGFLDTMDAFHSYQEKERKLEILKDSHIGAFAVIMGILYYLIYIAFFSEISSANGLQVLACGFFMSRCLSGIGIVFFQTAKKDGLLFLFADSAHERVVKIALYVQTILCVIFMLSQSVLIGTAASLSAFLCFGYYWYRSKKELGGITGDTAGYFVTICECTMVVVIAICEYIF